MASGIPDLVGSIKKHKKFKGLAGYSIQCLTKVIVPPAATWQANAKAAADLGAYDVISSVLHQFPEEESIFSPGATAISAMSSIPSVAAAMAENPAFKLLLEGFLEHYGLLAKTPIASWSEDNSNTLLGIGVMLLNVCNVAPERSVGQGVIPSVLKVIHTGAEAVFHRASEEIAWCLSQGLQSLDAVVRTREGRASLAVGKNMDTVVRGTASVINGPDLEGVTDVVDPYEFAEENLHLYYGFRVLEKCMRDDKGSSALKE